MRNNLVSQNCSVQQKNGYMLTVLTIEDQIPGIDELRQE